jgi:uncharacterized membrane protein
MFKKIRTHFFSGLAVLAPLFLTFVVIIYLVRVADTFVVNPVFRLLPTDPLDAQSKVILAKLIIAVAVFLFVIMMGMAAERLLFRQFLGAAEGLLKSIPLFNKVYGSIKEIAEAFSGDKKGLFKRVVFIEYPRKGIYTIGFVTQDKRWDASAKTGRELLSIFVPSPPNPATGLFVMVPKEETIESALSVEEAIKVVISCGAVVPPLR